MRIRHGGELRHFSQALGIPEKEILDFSSNINPLGPPACVKEVYEKSFKELSYYPDAEALEFRQEVARHFPLWPENVIVGNGAAEILDLILRFLKPRRALLIEPTFLEYRRTLNFLGTEIRSISLREKDSFQFLLSEIKNALQGVDVAIFANPNNPTGTFLSKENMLQILSEAKRKGIFVVLDEAFIDWINEISMGREIRDDSSFFVVRSLTKFYSLPGIRIGYGLGSRKLIEKLQSVQVPWSCNRLAQKLGIAVLRDDDFANVSRGWLVEERNRLQSLLQEISSLKVYPSAANFLLVRWGGRTDKERFFEEIGKQGIYVRDLSELPGLGPFYFRVAVRKKEENERLVEVLNVCLNQTRRQVA